MQSFNLQSTYYGRSSKISRSLMLAIGAGIGAWLGCIDAFHLPCSLNSALTLGCFMTAALSAKSWYQNSDGAVTAPSSGMPNVLMIGLLCASAAILPNLGTLMHLIAGAGSFVTFPLLAVGVILAMRLMNEKRNGSTMSGGRTGKNAFDQLNGLIDLHLSQGRLDEAESLSLHLLNMAES